MAHARSSGGRTGLPRILLGSVAEHVMRHIHSDVLVVPALAWTRPEKSVAARHFGKGQKRPAV
ncbi:MAG TPA: universal stress protein [Candidatus Binatia bacterium]|nr:universal stress protein [Candidatus Binatia bacterium]